MSLFETCKRQLGGNESASTQSSSGESTYYDFNFQGRQGRLQRVDDDQVRITIKLPDNYLTTNNFSYIVGQTGNLKPTKQGMSKGIILELGRYSYADMKDLFNAVDKTVKIAPTVRYLGQEGIMAQNELGEPQFVAQRKFLPALGPAIMTVTNDQIRYDYNPTDYFLTSLPHYSLEPIDLGMGDGVDVKTGTLEPGQITVVYTFDDKPTKGKLQTIMQHEAMGRAIADHYASSVDEMPGVVIRGGHYTLCETDAKGRIVRDKAICHFDKPEKLGDMQYFNFPHPKGREFAHGSATYQKGQLVFDPESQPNEMLTVKAPDMLHNQHVVRGLGDLVEAVEHAVAQENGLLDFLDSHQATDYQPKTLLDLKDLDILAQGLEQ